MNIKRIAVSATAVFVFIFLFDWLVHGFLLQGQYELTAHLWRPMAEMNARFHWMVTGQILMALMYTLIFLKGYENKGVAEGVRFGLFLGLFLAAPNLGMYAYMPISFFLVACWVVSVLSQAIGVGLILSYTSKPKS